MKDTENTSEEIVAMLWQRREAALDEILSRYGGLLKKIARPILPTAQDVEECMNDTLLDIWNTIPPQRPASIVSYAAMLIRRRAVDKLRYLTAQKRGGGAYFVALDELSDCIPGESALDEDAEELREALDGFLASLSAGDRQIFMGRYFAFASVEALALQNKTTKNSIHIRLTRIRKQLKLWLEERGIFV